MAKTAYITSTEKWGVLCLTACKYAGDTVYIQEIYPEFSEFIGTWEPICALNEDVPKSERKMPKRLK